MQSSEIVVHVNLLFFNFQQCHHDVGIFDVKQEQCNKQSDDEKSSNVDDSDHCDAFCVLELPLQRSLARQLSSRSISYT